MSTPRRFQHSARRVRELRTSVLLLTQRAFAAKLGVDPMTVSRWERGVVEPSELHRVLLARLSGGSPDDFRDQLEVAA